MKSFLLLVCALPAFVLPVSASLIFDNADKPQYQTLRSDEGIAAYLQIGSSDVNINQIAINAAPALSGQLKFVIFSDIAYPGNDAGLLLFSDAINVSSSNTLSYIQSGPISFTLQAGHYYDVGAILNGGNIAYAFDLAGDTIGGIASIARNENIGQFATPILLGHALGDAQIQLYSSQTDAPEPGTSALAALALSACALYVRFGREGSLKKRAEMRRRTRIAPYPEQC